MKKLLLLNFLILFFQCDELDKLTHFNIDNKSEFTIESTTIIDNPFDIYTPDITTNSSTEFSNNDTRADLIESIKLKSLRLNIKSPADGNFNFLKSVNIYINATDLDEVEIANIEDLTDDDLSTLNLHTINTELKDYLKKDSYTLRVKTVTDQVISEDYVIEADATFRVDAKVLGL